MKILPFLLLLLVVIGCKNSTQVSSGPSNSTTGTASTATGIRRVVLNQTKNFGGLDVTIGEVALEPSKVTVGITIVNTTKETLTTYPDQGELIIGKSQFENNMFMDDGNLGGEIHAGIEKRGSLAFVGENIDISAKQIDLRLNKVYGKNILKQTDIHFVLDLP